MKKKIILIISILALSGCQKNLAIITPKENLTFNYGETVDLNNLVAIENGTITNENLNVEYDNIGTKEVTINYEDTKKHKGKYTINIEIKDCTPPIISIPKNIYIKKATEVNLIKKAFIGDDFDPLPTVDVIGNYDTSIIGDYDLSMTATDKANNKSEVNFTLHVQENIANNPIPYTEDPISKIISEYKNDNTEIGIDVSTYQKNLNWQLIKEANIDFAILRIGYGHNTKNEIILDDTFEYNYQQAKENNIKVGIYFYSYATNKSEIMEQTQWIIERLKDKQLELPIYFDWESWKSFYGCNMSFKDLNDYADLFFNEIQNNGYLAGLYGSKWYLNNVWNTDNKNIWLAHYTTKTDYEKNYNIWQLTDTGTIPGIDNLVDIDILYK